MTALGLALWLALGGATLAAPGPSGAGGFRAGRMVAQPLADPSLPAGTVSVLVRKGRTAVQGLPVALLPAELPPRQPVPLHKALLRGTTNAEGRLFFKAALHARKRVRLVVVPKAPAPPQWSVPFTVPESGGVRFLFLMGGGSQMMGRPGHRPPGPHGHGAGPPPVPKAHGQASWLQLWVTFDLYFIDQQELYVALSYTLMNRGPSSFAPGAHGILLPVPQGAKSVALPRGIPGVQAGPKGVLITREIPSGEHGLQLQANARFAYSRADFPIHLRSVIPLIGFAVVTSAYRHVRVESPDLGPPEVGRHGGYGRRQRLYRSLAKGFPRTGIDFSFTGLPIRSRARSWPIAGLALLLVLAGLGLALWPRRKAPASTRAASGDDPALEQLLKKERDRRLGLIDPPPDDDHDDRDRVEDRE